ncbi:FAD binding domain-containing protein [Colletotrichum abscissum]|uniref:FAD binding domain-containing protein n=1 Tax=Colletotrichum abscissum TaxID=1671311 RepID=A0A9P9XD85_9PEZI|nr:FAD binding domain-containing protein [Colletotrichum abscissum]KAI3549168.1 FAD binding domain-containing protein [Colletotrichum abscissum]KAK1507234.1 FAD binding domain-containing protein [Colletotrichum abscissum]
MTTQTQAPVIIIGGSLVGLASALFLSARDVPVMLFERHTSSSPHPRAIGYTSRTLELLQTVGISPDQLKVGSGPPGGKPRRVKVKSLAGEWADEQLWNNNANKENGAGPKHETKKPGSGSGGPPPQQKGGKVYAPIMGTAIAQDRLEPILRKRAVELGADLRLGWKMTSWSQSTDGVRVTAVNRESGEEVTVGGSYIVACDGARSIFREGLRIGTTGVGHLRSLCSVMFRCAPIEKFLERGFVQFSIEGREDGFEAFLVSYHDGRWALMWNAAEETITDKEADGKDTINVGHSNKMDARAQKDLIRKALGLGEDEIQDGDIELVTIGFWEMSARIAEKFAEGRVFLAGDAAHTLPPNRGGYGANTGFADAHNLAWKIAAVRSGVADEGILGTYDEERRPVALVRHDQLFARDDYKAYIRGDGGKGKKVEVIDDIAMELGQIYRSRGVDLGTEEVLPDAMRPDEWKGQPGTRAPHLVVRKRDGKEISSLELFGRGWIVLSRDGDWKTAAVGAGCEFVHVGEDVVEVDEREGESFEETFGVGREGAVLVRPDGFVAWRVSGREDGDDEVFSEAFKRISFAL